MTVRKNLLEDTPPIQDSMVVAIKKVVIAKNREGRIAANDLEINNSYIRARQFIKNFSSQIFELFQAFHKCKDAKSSDLPYSIAILFPLVSIGKDEMSNLISMLSESIGQITAEDLLLINLSGKGFLKLREALFRHLTQSFDVARCAHDKEKKNASSSLRILLQVKLGRTFHLVRIIQIACGIFWENSTIVRFQSLSNTLLFQCLKVALSKVHPPH